MLGLLRLDSAAIVLHRAVSRLLSIPWIDTPCDVDEEVRSVIVIHISTEYVRAKRSNLKTAVEIFSAHFPIWQPDAAPALAFHELCTFLPLLTCSEDVSETSNLSSNLTPVAELL